MTTPPTPTLEQEARHLVNEIRGDGESPAVYRLTHQQAITLLMTFATRQRDKGVEESLNATIRRYQDEIQTQLRHERFNTARRCTTLALLADGGADPVGQGQRIATAIRAEFGLRDEAP